MIFPGGKQTDDSPIIVITATSSYHGCPLRLSVLLGKTKRSIADILKLTHGSIVELKDLRMNRWISWSMKNSLLAEKLSLSKSILGTYY